MRDEIGIGPAGQGALDASEDHGRRVVLGDPAHGLREGFGCGVLADLPGVGLPERQEAFGPIGFRGGFPLIDIHNRSFSFCCIWFWF
ncbi:hypothetical protein D3C80_1955820 [compost metagenome]